MRLLTADAAGVRCRAAAAAALTALASNNQRVKAEVLCTDDAHRHTRATVDSFCFFFGRFFGWCYPLCGGRSAP